MHPPDRRRLLRPAPLLLPVITVVAALGPSIAHAYVGPGAGLTALGTVLALMAAVLFAIVGFVWYPVKRLLKRSGAKAPAAEPKRPAE